MSSLAYRENLQIQSSGVTNRSAPPPPKHVFSAPLLGDVMRRTLTFSMISLIAALASACGPATPAPETTTAAAQNNCVQPAAPPKEGETPTCGEGCIWGGADNPKCLQSRGIGVPQRPDVIPGQGHGPGGNPNNGPPNK